MLVVGELTLERAEVAREGARAQIIYTDPPWGEGLLRYWRTHNGELGSKVVWRDFLETLAQVVHASIATDGHIFIEMGLAWADELSAVMADAGHQEVARWHGLYGSPKRPHAIWYSGPGVDADLSDLGGVRLVRTALASCGLSDGLVFDPCCGKGTTARAALGMGLRFAGVELNPRRAAVTAKILGDP
jgi:hypothetical protein